MSRCGLRKLGFRLKSTIFTCYYAVNRTYFSAQLAYRQETWFKFYFYIQKNSVRSLIQRTELFFIKFPFVFGCHSLLRHLFRFEFAVLLFDCERYKLAAGSIPQFFSKLGAIVFFAAFFLKRKRVSSSPCVLYSITYQEPSISASI